MGEATIKQWIGPIFAILYIMSISVILSPILRNDPIASISSYAFSLVFIPLILAVSMRFWLFWFLPLIIIIFLVYRHWKRDLISSSILCFSIFFSGVIWNLAPSSSSIAIDYVLWVFFIVPGQTYFFSYGQPIFLLALVILILLALITMEFVHLVTTRKMLSHLAAVFLLLVAIIWSFLPAAIMFFHPLVASVIPQPIGPLLALFSLPFIDRYYWKNHSIQK